MASRVVLRFYNREDPEKRVFMAELEGESLVIGRAKGCHLPLDDDDVSREHAQLDRVGGFWFVSDLESTNGVVVEGQRVRRAKLGHGSKFRVGDTVIEIRDRTAGLGRGR
ncbi:MAG: hypothetical protein CMJ83_03975 [Planctomycetes bacterium]|jgi:pSer/pThr/pTyr-binding forkhead associated (FHA) protein|nr:hypothetical protein [Planctomycetota bacterium]